MSYCISVLHEVLQALMLCHKAMFLREEEAREQKIWGVNWKTQ